jgi:hypothetical protein
MKLRIRSPEMRCRIFSSVESLESRLCLSTFTVLNTNDSGAGSLRQAITSANSNAGADLITFQSGLSGAINLTTSLLISDPLTITGPGASILTVRHTTSTTSPFRIFDSTASALTISGLTISGGNPQGNDILSGSGGALRVNATAPTVTLDGLIITGNTPNKEGGAL